MTMIAIVDCGVGNIRSVQKALEEIYPKVVITDKPDVVSEASGIVLPGVGSFGDAVDELKSSGLFEALRIELLTKPTLGICLGMQLLFESSEEDEKGRRGLGVFEGMVRPFPTGGVRVPHTGWNRLLPTQKPFFGGYVYFNHSYYCDPVDSSLVVANVLHHIPVPAVLSKNGILATQFHPEKSQEAGQKILRYWVETLKKQRGELN